MMSSSESENNTIQNGDMFRKKAEAYKKKPEKAKKLEKAAKDWTVFHHRNQVIHSTITKLPTPPSYFQINGTKTKIDCFDGTCFDKFTNAKFDFIKNSNFDEKF